MRWQYAEGRGPTWQTISRARPTEVNSLDGEVVRRGKSLNVPTPLEELAVRRLKRLAADKRFLTAGEIECALVQ